MRRLIQLDIALALAVIAGSVLYLVGPLSPIDTFQYDLALAQNHYLRANDAEETASPVAVVALDERSLDKFKDLPRVLLAPKWADLIAALMAANARAIGFDIVLAYPNKYFTKGWEQSFLRALADHKGRIVLGRSERVVPAARFQAAFGFEKAGRSFGAIEVRSDDDNVHRSVDAAILVGKKGSGQAPLPTLSKLLLAKAGRDDMPATVRLAPKRPLETLPTHSLSDVLECAKSHPDQLSRAFGNKIVLIGTTVASEDRKRTPDRFMSKRGRTGDKPPAAGDTCALDRQRTPQRGSQLVPSVYLHAAAIDAVLSNAILQVAPPWMPAGLGALLVFAFVWLGFGLQPLWTLAGLVAAACGLHIASGMALAFGFWSPTASLWLALAAASLIAYLARVLLVERRARLVQSAFNHYLTEDLVDRIIAAETPPSTGGERRDITVMFADLSGFTALSERVSPETLMDLTNAYLSIIVDEVQGAGGYVDKFIGDAVMAIWGAPADDPDHALNAVRTAQRIVTAVRARKARADAEGTPGYDVKIALNSGPAVVGNVGAKNRLNYSAVGRTVNIAARIEGLLSRHDTAILFGEDTAAQLGDRLAVRAVGEAQLKGVAQSVKLFAPASDM